MKMFILAASVLPALFIVSVTQAASISNGSMNDGNVGTDYNGFNTVVPTDWSSVGLNTPDLFDANTNFGSFAWNASTDGGTFVHGLAQGNSDEGVFQDLTGLVIGQTYAVSFEQSISNRAGFNASGDLGAWSVTLGGATLLSDNMTTPTLLSAVEWHDQTLFFEATATTDELVFVAHNVTGTRVDLGLDGVSITAIPVPGAAWLFGSAIGLLGWIRRKAACSLTTAPIRKSCTG